jgi:putative transcriptional regulator
MNEPSSHLSLHRTLKPALWFAAQAVYAKFDGYVRGQVSLEGSGSYTSLETKLARSISSLFMRSQSQKTSHSPHSRRFVVSSKSKKLNSSEIAAFEAKRDIGAEILRSLQDMKAGKGKVVISSATEAREATGLSQSQFANLLGVSVRTLQGWEQGRKQPSGAARTLLAIARTNPKVVLAVSAQ